MAEKKQLSPFGILILLGVGYLIISIFGFPGQDRTPNQVICDVKVSNDLLFDSEISAFDCNIAYSGLCNFDTNIISKQAIFSDEVKLELILGGEIVKSKQFKVIETGEEDITLSACSKLREGQLKLRDDDGIVLDSKDIEV